MGTGVLPRHSNDWHSIVAGERTVVAVLITDVESTERRVPGFAETKRAPYFGGSINLSDAELR